jgi:hypothetical protein
MDEGLSYDLADQKAIEEAIRVSQRMGRNTCVLLVGSRAAGFEDNWSDLNLWLLGDREALPDEERQQLDSAGWLGFPLGDTGVQVVFRDVADVQTRLNAWDDEQLWGFLNSHILYGPYERVAEIKRRFSGYPRPVLERKVRWFYGRYVHSLDSLNVAARGMREASVLVIGHVIESVCKLCCLAEGKPYPYPKWVVEAARRTEMGRTVGPMVRAAVGGMAELLDPPRGTPYDDLVPIRELRATREPVASGLRAQGWTNDWLDQPEEAVADYFRRRVP